MNIKMKKGSKKARLSAARLAAVQTVYQMRSGNHSAINAARDFLDHYSGMEVDGNLLLEPDTALYSKIVQGVEKRIDELQVILSQSLNNQTQAIEEEKKKSMEALLEAILLCGIYEIVSHRDIDAPIIISDYINVTYAFYDKSESGLVNAVLDRLASNLRV